MKKWLAALLMLCLCMPCAFAEEELELDLDVEAQIESVDDAVGETTLDLGGGGTAVDDAHVAEEYTFVPPSSKEVYYLDCPDVYDIKNVVSASQRVYPGALLWPLKGKQPPKRFTSHVGWRNAARIHSGQGGAWPSWLHHGVDVGNVTRRQLVVVAASGVAYAGEQRGNGRYVVIDHGNGFYTKYQHLSRFAGEMFDGCREVPVEAGDPIGYVGNSGGDYPVHFHFEIAWSPDGPGSDDITYHRETHNRTIKAYSFPQQSVVRMHWAERWEICSAEYQTFIADLETPVPDESEEPADGTIQETDSDTIQTE